MNAAPARRKRILLGQLAARGDCLYATAIARQIKADYPGCHLTWAVGSASRPVLDGNPYIDAIWEIPVANYAQLAPAWAYLRETAAELLKKREIDEAFFPQIDPENFRNYDCTIRASIFRGYPRPITVPLAPVVRLTDAEVTRVREFAQAHRLTDHSPVILFEFAGHSEQSFVTTDFAYETCRDIAERLPDCRIVMSSQIEIVSNDPHIISGHTLSFRENAELTRYCSLLVGCSSGITWLATSDWAKPLPTIQLLRRDKGVYASVAHDHEHFGLSTEHVLEMTDCPREDVVDCVVTAVSKGFAEAKKQYHQQLQPDFTFYVPKIKSMITKRGYRDVLQSNWFILRRYGPTSAVLRLLLATAQLIFADARAKVLTCLRRAAGPAGKD